VQRTSRAYSKSDARRSIALYRLRDAECHEKGRGANRPEGSVQAPGLFGISQPCVVNEPLWFYPISSFKSCSGLPGEITWLGLQKFTIGDPPTQAYDDVALTAMIG
jgi:hypothetical protein